MKHHDTALFRAWLIEKLKRSRWTEYRTDDLPVVAERLGVTESVLREAQASLDADRTARGERKIQVGTRSYKGKRKIVDLEMPITVAADWKAYCEARGLVSSTLLRSLIYTLLCGPRNPTWVGPRWHYRGTVHLLVGYMETKKSGKQWPHGAKTEITHGASRALLLRAQNARCKPTALLRGMAIDLLEGKLTEIQIVSTSAQMWDDETRYWTGTDPPKVQ